jgi:hypothetical protein
LQTLIRGIRRRWIGWTVLALLAPAIVWLVFFWGVVRQSWTEEVELAPGDVVVIERRMKFVKVSSELFRSGLQTRYNSLRLPDGARFETEDRISLIWLGRGASPGTWRLIAVANYCEEFRKYGLTDYVQLEYADGRWSHRALEPEYFGRAANVLVAYGMAREGALVTSDEKKQWNSETYGPDKRYLRIQRDQRDLDVQIRSCSEGRRGN